MMRKTNKNHGKHWINIPVFEHQPELMKLRRKSGWAVWQIAAVLKVDRMTYADAEWGRIYEPELMTRAREIFKSGVRFSPLLTIPDVKVMQERNYILTSTPLHGRGNAGVLKKLNLKFERITQGAGNTIHYLFRDKGGSIISFTATQLMDYKIQ